MQALTERLLRSNLPDVFSDVDVGNLLGEASGDRRHALVKRALARGRAAISGGGCLCTPDRMEEVRGSKPIALHREGDAYVGIVDFGTEKELI